MQEVICFHCGNAVPISPDRSLCPECGEDLQHLLAPEFVADYFYTRAQELANQGEPAAALAQVERGLTYAASAELHLLAAILAQQVERYDLMRHHVAAIAVDDTLRPEAEWLLRAHQARQRALRGQDAAQRAPGGATALLDELLGRNQGDEMPPAMRPLQTLWPALAVMALLGLVAVAYLAFSETERASQTAEATRDATPPEEAALPTQAAEPPAQEEVTLLPTPTPTPAALPGALPELETPELDVPDNVVQAADAATAASGPRPVVIIAATSFDLARYLRENGRPELAALGVEARLQESTLILRGVVQLDRQRRELVELLSTAPGVSEVNTVDLLLLPAPTYMVQDGDTLWTIVYDIYGDAERMPDLIELNRDVMPVPELLSPGMELKVPPVQ